MFRIKNFEDNNDVKIVEELGAFKVVEYLKDLSVDRLTAQAAYYASEMNVRRRQLVCDVSLSDITVQSGAMQWMVGNVSATTGLKGVGDFLGKALRGKSRMNPQLSLSTPEPANWYWNRPISIFY